MTSSRVVDPEASAGRLLCRVRFRLLAASSRLPRWPGGLLLQDPTTATARPPHPRSRDGHRQAASSRLLRRPPPGCLLGSSSTPATVASPRSPPVLLPDSWLSSGVRFPIGFRGPIGFGGGGGFPLAVGFEARAGLVFGLQGRVRRRSTRHEPPPPLPSLLIRSVWATDRDWELGALSGRRPPALPPLHPATAGVQPRSHQLLRHHPQHRSSRTRSPSALTLAAPPPPRAGRLPSCSAAPIASSSPASSDACPGVLHHRAPSPARLLHHRQTRAPASFPNLRGTHGSLQFHARAAKLRREERGQAGGGPSMQHCHEGREDGSRSNTAAASLCPPSLLAVDGDGWGGDRCL
ncbi:hypothetical protein BS78_09G075300 [Paspalum vaginatum]|nr:hypothetical protein BS78_09G075300 [Paspalum vaginatum]